MKREILLGMIVSLVAGSSGRAASAERVYRLTGRVAQLTSDSIEVVGPDQRLVLPRDSEMLKKTPLKPGDEVNLWYSVTPHKLEVLTPRGASSQQPGQVEVPDTGKVIEDDRLFLDAKNRDARFRAERPHS